MPFIGSPPKYPELNLGFPHGQWWCNLGHYLISLRNELGTCNEEPTQYSNLETLIAWQKQNKQNLTLRFRSFYSRISQSSRKLIANQNIIPSFSSAFLQQFKLNSIPLIVLDTQLANALFSIVVHIISKDCNYVFQLGFYVRSIHLKWKPDTLPQNSPSVSKILIPFIR